MLWHLVDVLAVLLALAIVVMGMPGRVARRWRQGFFDRLRSEAHSKARPRRERSSSS